MRRATVQVFDWSSVEVTHEKRSFLIHLDDQVSNGLSGVYTRDMVVLPHTGTSIVGIANMRVFEKGALRLHGPVANVDGGYHLK